MREDFYISLIYKQLNGETTDEENRQLEEWLLQDETHQTIANEIQMVYAMSDDYLKAEAADIDVNAAFEQQMALIENEKTQPSPLKVVVNNSSQKSKVRRLGGMTKVRWIGVAASAAILLIAGFWWMTSGTDAYEIVAATDGKVVKLKDGSMVTLTKGSILKYANSYDKTDRNVELSGQAFFDVEKGETPFKVKTTHSEVTVLGTEFDVREEKQAKMVYLKVTEGKVNIQLNGGENMNVEAGQQVTGDALAGRFKIPKPIPRSVSKDFSFENDSIEKVVSDLSLAYGIEISFDERMKHCLVTVNANNEPLEKVLTRINKLLGSETIKENDGSYIIEGEGCDE